MEIGTSALKTPEELLEKVTNVLKKFREDTPRISTQEPEKPKEPEAKKPEETTQPSTSDTKPKSDENFQVVCEGDVCYKKPVEKQEEKVLEKVAETVATSDQKSAETEEKVKRAMQLIEQKKKEKADEEARVSSRNLVILGRHSYRTSWLTGSVLRFLIKTFLRMRKSG